MSTTPTLLDIAKLNGTDAAVGLIDESIKACPEISGLSYGQVVPGVGFSRTIKGTIYKTLVRTSKPSGAFRNANEGAPNGKSNYENRTVETFIFNPKWRCDKAVADAHEDGHAAYVAMEGVAMTSGAMESLGTQFYYGRTAPGDAKGHPGLIDSVNSSMVVDATGSTTGAGSSVWFVKFGMSHVCWVYGQDGSVNLSELRTQDVADPNDATKSYTAYLQEILAYAGVQVGSIYSTARIKNLTTQSGKTLTDEMLYSALETFPSHILPDAIFLTRRSLGQLRKSRTATNATGAPAPLPRDFEGIPLVVTESIKNTEAIA